VGFTDSFRGALSAIGGGIGSFFGSSIVQDVGRDLARGALQIGNQALLRQVSSSEQRLSLGVPFEGDVRRPDDIQLLPSQFGQQFLAQATGGAVFDPNELALARQALQKRPSAPAGLGVPLMPVFPGSSGRSSQEAAVAQLQRSFGGGATAPAGVALQTRVAGPMAGVGGISNPFRGTMAGAVAQKFVMANPATGATTWFGPLGQPILFSRDVAVCRRAKRIARKIAPRPR